MRLANKVVIITGAASGIGRASAIVFAQEGAKVIAGDINDADGKETVAIINIGAGAGLKPPMPGSSAYASSKGAVITLTKEVALEMVPYDVRVTCINPGGTETPMLKKISEDTKAAGAGDAGMGKHSGLYGGRLTKPEEIAYAAVFLASDEALMLSGIHLNVTAGGVW